MKKSLCLLIIVLVTFKISFAQDLYKTPSGSKYHLSTCRMVENVSSKLLSVQDVSHHQLSPCKICKPPRLSELSITSSYRDKSVGKSKSVRCIGRTQAGSRCKHKTRLANGYCYQHTHQNSRASYQSNTTRAVSSSRCGAKTKSGRHCTRKVRGGARCYQHR